MSARLVVAADGAHSVVRAAAGIEADVEDYDQIAVVANVARRPASRWHRLRAIHPVRSAGGVAAARRQLWCRLDLHAGPRRAEVLALDDDTYLRELQERFGWRAGRFVRAGVRASYPLKLTRAATTVAPALS